MTPDTSLSRRQFLARTAAAGATLAAGSFTTAAQPAGQRFQLVGFSKPFQSLSYADTADTVAEIGWDGIECPVRPKGQIEPGRAADELPKLVEALKKRSKELSIVTTAIKSVSEPHAEATLRTMAKLGLRRYRLGFWKYDLQKPIAPQLADIGAALRDLAALNQELGLQAGFQNHSGRDYVGAPVWDVWSIIRDLDPRQMGVCFDIGHATIEGGYSWGIEARLIEPFFTAVYVKDFIWQKTDRGTRAQWVMLGEGLVDKAFFAWLKTTRYAGPICQHHEYDHGQGKPMIAKMQQDLKVLREWLNG
jgi:sugar phosphate isomerase/epimerase